MDADQSLSREDEISGFSWISSNPSVFFVAFRLPGIEGGVEHEDRIEPLAFRERNRFVFGVQAVSGAGPVAHPLDRLRRGNRIVAEAGGAGERRSAACGLAWVGPGPPVKPP